MSDNDALIPEAGTGPAAQPAPVRQGMWGKGSGDTSGYNGLRRSVEWPAAAVAPYGSWFDDALGRLSQLVADPFSTVVVDHGELTVYVARERIVEVMQALRDDAYLRFEFCASVSGVHYPDEIGSELHVVYHLQSMTHNRRIRIETSCPDADPHVPSIIATYPTVDWHERETWDMFGIIFDGHPHLTRILMPDDWVGHPQRKDYPLGGIPIEFKGTVVPPVDSRRSY